MWDFARNPSEPVRCGGTSERPVVSATWIEGVPYQFGTFALQNTLHCIISHYSILF